MWGKRVGRHLSIPFSTHSYVSVGKSLNLWVGFHESFIISAQQECWENKLGNVSVDYSEFMGTSRNTVHFAVLVLGYWVGIDLHTHAVRKTV